MDNQQLLAEDLCAIVSELLERGGTDTYHMLPQRRMKKILRLNDSIAQQFKIKPASKKTIGKQVFSKEEHESMREFYKGLLGRLREEINIKDQIIENMNINIELRKRLENWRIIETAAGAIKYQNN